jgi:hypothetical protein
MRWDGNLWRWSIVPIPNPGVGDNRLTSVTALSSNDVWAVGNILTDIRGDTLIEHWDGSQWTWIPSVSPGAYHNTLDGVAAISSEDVWAVGSLTNCIGCEFFSLIEHYFNPCVTPSPTPSGTPPTLSPTRTRTPTPTGTRPTNSPTWTFVPTSTGTPTTTATATLTPRPCEPETNYIITESLGATVVPGTVDIGNHCDDCTTTIDLPFPFTFYGQTFTSANVSSNGNIQFASNDPSHDNVCVPYAPVRYAILPHWDDLHTENAGCFDCGIFTSVTGSAPNRIFNIEWDTTFLSSGSFPVSFQLRLYENSPEQRFDIIYDSISRQGSSATVGIQRGPNEAFVQYECNTAGSITGGLQLSFTLAPCPPPSATPSSSFTPTVTPATTNTVTPCPMAFIDVREADYFYVPVRYLYCAGVISGYADNTFRPYNNTTRGQLCKIVVLAEGWPLQCPANPTFSDVPVDNTFFCYVETAVSHGTISGYSDGTFRPYNNVTRGQLCKIVVLARGWEADCTTQHFSDVPPSHPFFCYIEVAFNHEIISGYADGTFRPGNSAIRGQISKIAYNALTSP